MPPTIKRQVPPKPAQPAPDVGNGAVEVLAGSMLADAVPVSRLQREHVRVCIYGRNRVGKTTLAAQFAKPVLFISCEPDANGGADSISNMGNLVVIQRISHKMLGQDRDGRWLDATDPRCVRYDKVKGLDKVVALANELEGKHPFKTVVLDTVTSLEDIALVEMLGLSRVPVMKDWGTVPDGMYQRRAEKFRSTVRPLIDLNNCNIVILAQERDHNPSRSDEERGGRSKLMHTLQHGSYMAPSVGATNAKWLQDTCGYVVQLYDDEVMQEIAVPSNNPDGTPGLPMITKVGTGKRQRHIRLLYHPNFAAGSRTPYDRDVPEYVTAPTPAELYAAMAKYIPTLEIAK